MAFLTALTVTPPVRVLARRLGATDDPNKARKVHDRVIPRMGGLAIAAAFFFPLVILWGIETEVAKAFIADRKQIVILAFGGLMILALGVYDDRRGARASTKLAIQLPVAVLLVLSGFTFDANVSFLGFDFGLGVLAPAVTILWIVGITNAMNLIDGLDGLAAGISLLVVLTLFVLSLVNQHYVGAMLNACLAGALVGFLVHNFHPATIFMGDTGSLFIGYMIASIALLTSSKGTTTVAFLVPVIALSVPIMDTTLATFRRLLRNRSPFSADQEHMHHKLLHLGFSHQRVVLIMWAFALATCLTALGVAFVRGTQVWSVLVIYSVVVFVVVKKMGFIRVDNWQGEFKAGRNLKQKRKKQSKSIEQMQNTFKFMEHPDQLPGLLLPLHQLLNYAAMQVQLSDSFLVTLGSTQGRYVWPGLDDPSIWSQGRSVTYPLEGRYGPIGEVTYVFLSEKAIDVEEEQLLDRVHQLMIEGLERIQRANSNIGLAGEEAKIRVLPSA